MRRNYFSFFYDRYSSFEIVGFNLMNAVICATNKISLLKFVKTELWTIFSHVFIIHVLNIFMCTSLFYFYVFHDIFILSDQYINLLFILKEIYFYHHVISILIHYNICDILDIILLY